MGQTIEHVVVVMLENRSYDNVLSWLEGVGDWTNPNPDGKCPDIPVGNLAQQTIEGNDQTYPGTCIPLLDPGEKFGDMAQQFLGVGSVPTSNPYTNYPGTSKLMQGFTLNYAQILGGNTHNIPDVMNLFTEEQLPVTSFLARNYAVCTNWCASVPSQTYVNRIFALCAAPAIVKRIDTYSVVNDEDHSVDYLTLLPGSAMIELDSLFSQLDAVYGSGSVNWKLYLHDYSIATFLLPYVARKATSNSNANVSTFDTSDWGTNVPPPLAHVPSTFVDDVTGGTLPRFSWIEPRYSRTHATNHLEPNSNHPGPGDYGILVHSEPTDPPIDATGGELLLMQVYNLLRNSSYWDSTLLIITYDEPGGIFDHVPLRYGTPPGTVQTSSGPMAVPPANYDVVVGSNDPAVVGFDYNVLGGRVPAIVVSPQIAAGIDTTDYDHTTIIKTAWELFNLSTKNMSSLTARDANAASLTSLLSGSSSTNTTGAFSGTIVPSPSAVILNGSRLLGTPSLTLLASAGGGIELTVTTSGGELPNGDVWLTVETSAPTTATDIWNITIGVTNIHLDTPAGTYTGTITIASSSDSVDVPVTFKLD